MVGGVKVAGIAQGRLENLGIREAEFSGDAIEGCPGGQAAHTVGAPQVHVLAGDPDSAGKFGLTDAVGALVGVNEFDQVRGLHSPSVRARQGMRQGPINGDVKCYLS